MRSVALTFSIAVVLSFGSAKPASASLVYTCDATVGSSYCSYLNGTVAGIYNSMFSNVSADIYIQMGSTGLGQSSQFLNSVSYSQYVNALNANPNKDAVDVSALAALSSFDSAIYGSGNVIISSALAAALGFSGATGTTSTGSSCSLPSANCYDGVITVSNTQPLYYRSGLEASNQYDFYTVAQHETDEVLGTISCITTSGGSWTDFCGTGVPAPIDLFRYSSAGNLVPNSSLSSTPGAYFSYNGGSTNGANGAVFNTSTGNDYADFVSGCPTTVFVQSAVGCPGHDGGVNVNNDGPGGTFGPESTMLNAIGYQSATPEPATLGMLVLGFAILAILARRRSAAGKLS